MGFTYPGASEEAALWKRLTRTYAAAKQQIPMFTGNVAWWEPGHQQLIQFTRWYLDRSAIKPGGLPFTPDDAIRAAYDDGLDGAGILPSAMLFGYRELWGEWALVMGARRRALWDDLPPPGVILDLLPGASSKAVNDLMLEPYYENEPRKIAAIAARVLTRPVAELHELREALCRHLEWMLADSELQRTPFWPPKRGAGSGPGAKPKIILPPEILRSLFEESKRLARDAARWCADPSDFPGTSHRGEERRALLGPFAKARVAAQLLFPWLTYREIEIAAGPSPGVSERRRKGHDPEVHIRARVRAVHILAERLQAGPYTIADAIGQGVVGGETYSLLNHADYQPPAPGEWQGLVG